MCTSQKYEGKGTNARVSTPAVEIRRYTPLSADERDALTHNLDIMQGELLSLVDDFASIGNGTDPVALLADLLQDLLSKPANELASEMTRGQLKAGLGLISFFSEARQRLHERNELFDVLELGKEVRGGK